ncbi:MAG TPA: enoyl-CoA hydratase-related protein, partial [Polyangiaceae bacterium]
MTAPLRALDALRVSVEDHVATVVLRAAGKANRMGPAFWAEMPEAFEWLDAEADVRAVVVRGEGEHFSYGLDLATMGGELSSVVGDGALAKERTDFLAAIERLQRAMSCVAACRKPVVAAIAGWCVGGGVDLATACDVRLCSADARFSVREVKLAMVADVGTLARLPALVGQGNARLLAMTGDDVDAARALRIGLVEEVHDTHAALFEAAKELARRIAAN